MLVFILGIKAPESKTGAFLPVRLIEFAGRPTVPTVAWRTVTARDVCMSELSDHDTESITIQSR